MDRTKNVINKDMSLLKTVSDYFTEDILRHVVAEEKNADKASVNILSWQFEELSGKGDNYLSVVNKLYLRSEVNREICETSIIVKSLPNNLVRRKIFRSTEYFHNEIIFYTQIARKFNLFLKEKERCDFLSIPKCLAYHLDGEHDFIVLQDVTPLGYHSIARQSCLDYKECKSIIEVMARFHAVSLAYKSIHSEEFSKDASLLKENFYRNDIYESLMKYLYTNVFEIAKEALEKEFPNSEATKKFGSYEVPELFERTIEICSRKDEPSSVICQGDTWAPNFMMRQVSPDKVDILILDFQLTRCASPALDVTFFIYQCTDKSLRDEYYDQLLSDYYTEFAKTMTVLGADPSKQYPWETFQKEVKEQSLYGLMFAILNIPISLIPENAVPDLESINEEEMNLADLTNIPKLEKAEDRRRLADVILHGIEKEYF